MLLVSSIPGVSRCLWMLNVPHRSWPSWDVSWVRVWDPGFSSLLLLGYGWAVTQKPWVYPVMNWNSKPMSLKKPFIFKLITSGMFYSDEKMTRTWGTSTSLCIHQQMQFWRHKRPLNEESVPCLSPASTDPVSTYILYKRRERSASLNLAMHFLSVHCVSFSLTELSLEAHMVL